MNQYTYDVWGNPRVIEEQTPNVLRYAGEYWDEETGLQYLRSRWYDPNLGRFINEDIYEGDKAEPSSLNLYTYVKNNPLIYIDPSGHREEMSPGGGGGGISPLSRISSSPKISSNSRLMRSSPIKSLNELKDEVRGIQASRTSAMTKSSVSTKGKGNNTSAANKSRSAPADTGIPNSTKIDRDSNGNITKYTTYGSDGKILKEVRIDGKDHGSIPRPNVKEPTFNTNPKTGQQFQNGYQVRPAYPNEIPNSRK